MTSSGSTDPQFGSASMSTGGEGAPGALGIARQRRVWSKRADQWDHGSLPGLDKVIDTVLAQADPTPSLVAVDLGCGTGQLSLPLASKVAKVTAVDVSPRMVELLRTNTEAGGYANVECVVSPIERLDLPPASVDLVVSNYALHHLRDRDKAALVASAARWLRPGGKLVIGDMMFGRGAEAHDWAIAANKIGALMRRGPGGMWRVVKNLWRYFWRAQERPVSMTKWASMMRDAGFTDISTHSVIAEAAVVAGRLPTR